MRSHTRPLLILCFTFSSLMGAMMLLPASTQGTIGGALTAQVTPPADPVLLEPINGQITDATPTFKWQAVPGVKKYRFYLANHTEPDISGPRDSSYAEVTGTSWKVPEPLPVGLYQWFLSPEGSPYYTMGVFANGVLPPTACKPNYLISNLQPTFTWPAATPPYTFRLIAVRNSTRPSSDPQFLNQTTDLSTNSFSPDVKLEAGRVYVWFVWDKSNKSVCAASFLIPSLSPPPPPPPPPTLQILGPSGALDTLKPTISWTEVPKAKYDVRIVDLSEQKTMMVNGMSPTSYTPPVAFKPGHRYAAVVVAKRAATPGNPALTLKSDPVVFWVPALSVPALQQPDVSVPGQVKLNWDTVTNAGSYDVVVTGMGVSFSKIQNVTTNSLQMSGLPKGSYAVMIRAKGSAPAVGPADSEPMTFVVQ